MVKSYHKKWYFCPYIQIGMSVLLDEKDLQKLIVIGDRILIKPKTPQSKTKSGLYLPPGVNENEKVQIGYVLKVGPGYPIPSVNDTDEPWKNRNEEPKYVPLQPKEGDQAVYLQNSAIEIEFNKEKYIVVPQSAILLLLRDDGLFE
jgi:co-chaperonin GroES (HSP10)